MSPALEKLEKGDFTDAEKQFMKKYRDNLSLPQNRFSIRHLSLEYGKEFLKKHGYNINIEKLNKPRSLALQLISLAEVARRSSERLAESNNTETSEHKRINRIKLLIELGVLSELLLEGVDKWENFNKQPGFWQLKGKQLTATEILSLYDEGVREFESIHLFFGIEKDRDFSEAVLEGTKFKGSSLKGGIFKDANLENTEFNSCSLFLANLNRANLRGAKINSSNFHGAYLVDTNLALSTLWEADFSAAYLHNVSFIAATIESSKLSPTLLGDLNLLGAKISRNSLMTLTRGDWSSSSSFVDKVNILGKKGGTIFLSHREMGLGSLTNIILNPPNIIGSLIIPQQDGKEKYKGLTITELNSLNQGEWALKSWDEKRALWRKKGGIVIGDTDFLRIIKDES
jgi:uncharacterized protein YjbI with pentapeptide repeats